MERGGGGGGGLAGEIESLRGGVEEGGKGRARGTTPRAKLSIEHSNTTRMIFR